ncbi:MAG: DUF192 domain-containing protein [Bacteroidota bacterium]
MRALFLLLLGLLMGCQPPDSQPVIQTNISFQKEGTLTFLRPDSTELATLDIEIADTDAERATGLMHRRSMPAQSGMLFLFDEPDSLSFWMRNTPMPLDIVFIGADRRIVNIVRRTTPFSEERVLATGLAQYVVEVRAGEADRLGLAPGVLVTWDRVPPLSS